MLRTPAIALALVAASIAHGQGWDAAGSLGFGTRAERGNTLVGVRMHGALRRVASSGAAYELGAGYAQMTARYGAAGDGPNVKENSLELFARAERSLAAGGRWGVVGSAAPVLSVAMGCLAGGSFVADSLKPGGAECTNDFADHGSVRLGGAVRLAAERRAARAALVVGIEAAAGTVAAGNVVGLGAFVGFRTALR